MEFCDKCGSSMIPKKSGKSVVLICRRCGKKKRTKVKKGFKITAFSGKKSGKIIVIEKKSKFEVLPKTTITCPKCDNNKALWWMQQMRAADEPATRFYKCTKCGHVWREYE